MIMVIVLTKLKDLLPMLQDWLKSHDGAFPGREANSVQSREAIRNRASRLR